MKLSEAIGWFYISMTGVVSESTVTFYKRRLPSLENYIGSDTEIASITSHQLNAWRASLANRTELYSSNPKRKKQGKLSPYTLHQYVRCVRRLFRWMHEANYLPHNPSTLLKLPPLPKQVRRGISHRDVIRMFQTARKGSIREYAMIKLLYDSGCRVGGLAGLTLRELDLPHCRAVVHEKGRMGNNKERVIYFKHHTVIAIRAWLKIRPQTDHDYLFTAQHHSHKTLIGAPLTENGVYQALKRIAKKAGVEGKWNPHEFRHAAIRGWLNNGMPLNKASQLAGHSSTRITGDIYGTSNERELQEAYQKWG